MSKKQSRRTFIKGAGVAAGGLLTPAVVQAQQAGSSATRGDQFRNLLQGPEPVLAPGVHDVLTARLVEHMGFPAMTVGGSAVSAEHVIPDVGLITITELIEFAGN